MKNKILLSTLIVGIFMYALHTKNVINQPSLTIGFMGDVMIGRLVNEIVSTKGYTYPWGNTLPLLQSVDVRIINLESTLTHHTRPVPKVFNFRATPDRVALLQSANITIANLANNHSLDFQKKGLLETIKTLDDAQILHVGAGENAEEAQKPLIMTKNNITIGVIGYTDNEPTWKATHNKPGTHYISVGDIKTVKKDIETLKRNVDIIIATIHWGPNMREHPSQEFIDFAHQMIDAGIDIIHGHSSHAFQGIEVYHNKLILYDTGDFIDDYAVDETLRNDYSCFFAVTIDKNGPQSVVLTPIVISNMQVNIATDTDKKIILDLMKKRSQQFGTQISDDGVLIISS